MECGNYNENSEDAKICQEGDYLADVDTIVILHSVHNYIVNPESHDSIQVIGRTSEVIAASIRFNFTANPKRSCILINKL